MVFESVERGLAAKPIRPSGGARPCRGAAWRAGGRNRRLRGSAPGRPALIIMRALSIIRLSLALAQVKTYTRLSYWRRHVAPHEK
jgi:hypothetical protein